MLGCHIYSFSPGEGQCPFQANHSAVDKQEPDGTRHFFLFRLYLWHAYVWGPEGVSEPYVQPRPEVSRAMLDAGTPALVQG